MSYECTMSPVRDTEEHDGVWGPLFSLPCDWMDAQTAVNVVADDDTLVHPGLNVLTFTRIFQRMRTTLFRLSVPKTRYWLVAMSFETVVGAWLNNSQWIWARHWSKSAEKTQPSVYPLGFEEAYVQQTGCECKNLLYRARHVGLANCITHCRCMTVFFYHRRE